MGAASEGVKRGLRGVALKAFRKDARPCLALAGLAIVIFSNHFANPDMFYFEPWYVLHIFLLCTFIHFSLACNALLDPKFKHYHYFKAQIKLHLFQKAFFVSFKKLSLSSNLL